MIHRAPSGWAVYGRELARLSVLDTMSDTGYTASYCLTLLEADDGHHEVGP